MSLSDIAVFAQVVESGSFTAAAERLALSKPVVSKYVSRLEHRLGVRLLHRTTRRLSLTEAGRTLYEHSRPGLDTLAQAEAAVTELQASPRGHLRLNTPMSFGILHIAPALPDFLHLYPDISVDMHLEDRRLDIVEEGFDLSLRIADLPDSSLVARRLAPCRHVVVAAPSYLQERGSPETPGDLARHNIVSYRYQGPTGNWHFRGRDGHAVTVAVGGNLQMDNSLALRETLLRGVGIARTPSFVVGEDLQSGRLQVLLEDYETLELSIYLVYPERAHLPPKVRAFIDFMAQRIGDEPYWDRRR